MNCKRSLLLVALAALAGGLAGALPSSTPAARASAQDTHSDFRKRFNAAMKLNSTKELARLVKTMNFEAVTWIMETAEAISNQSSEELETRMSALRKAWREAEETDFADNVYEYFSLLPPAQKTERWKLMGRYGKANDKYRANLAGDKDGQVYGLLSVEFEGLAGDFERLGDKYYASECWILHGSCNRDDLRGEGADLYKTYAAYIKAVELREAVGLKDRLWLETKNYAEALGRKGFGGEKPGEGAGGAAGGGAGPPAGGAPEATGAALRATMTFELVDDLLEYERPLYVADDQYPMWNGFYLQAKGSTGRLNTLEQLSPTAHRTGSSQITLDTDGDGEPDLRVPITGNKEPVQFDIGTGEDKRPWGILTTIGIDQDFYQGFQISLLPQDGFFTLYVAPAASVVGALGDVQVRVFDDNMDAVYGSPPKSWENTGMSKGRLQPEFDSILIGDEDRARPWSEYLEIDGQWYQLAVARNGMVLEATPVEVETGTLTLKFKGGRPKWLIVRGKGRWENSYFDISSGKVQVPAGKYELCYGELRKGKKRSEIKTLIIPGEETPGWDVEVGGQATVELGAPFGFDFEFERSGDNVAVVGQSVVVTGVAGERYERPWGCVPRPDASWRKEGSKKGSKGEEMGLIMDQSALSKHDWRSTWSPLDVTLTLRANPDRVEVQLVEKKHKLFGKIESVWRPE